MIAAANGKAWLAVVRHPDEIWSEPETIEMNLSDAKAWGRVFGETDMPVRDPVEDRDYFARRAREERELAATCEDNAVAMAHLQMADEYSKRANDLAAERDTTAS